MCYRRGYCALAPLILKQPSHAVAFSRGAKRGAIRPQTAIRHKTPPAYSKIIFPLTKPSRYCGGVDDNNSGDTEMTRHEIMDAIRDSQKRIRRMEQHGDAYKDSIDYENEMIQGLEDELDLIEANYA